jgi:hypothetical protein
MNRPKKATLTLGTMVVAVALLAVGCASIQRWNVIVNKTTPASIEVDLIGVALLEKPAWEGYSIDKYFTRGDPRRKNADRLTQTLQIGQPWVVSMDDPKWSAWLGRGATELLVIANLPGRFEPGSADPRRVFVPLNKKAWRPRIKNALDIEVQESVILVLTPQKPR